MKKIIIFLSTAIVFFAIFSALMFKSTNLSFVQINGARFFVDVAKTNEQKEKGLDIYNKLPLKRGMLFPFDTLNYYPFWMNGMKFSIDIIYINNNRIVDIFPNLPFPKTSTQSPIIVRPTQKANYVLEINAGLSQKFNFKKGDIVTIHL